jgi:hypothetical protein
MPRMLSAEDLLVGASTTFTIEVPVSVLRPDESGMAGSVTLRPLTVGDIQRVTQAAKEQKVLASILMVQQALVAPRLAVEQVVSLPAGLVEFLIGKVNELSGLQFEGDDLDRAVKAPLAKACFVLAREFGWTPAQCSELTVGQILVFLEMLARGESPGGVAT